MPVRIRLQRFGCTHHPFFRMVAANGKAPRNGKFLELLGTYNPVPNKFGLKEMRMKQDRVKYWISVGAQPTSRVEWILGKFGILPAPPRKYSPVQMVPRKERKEAEKAAEKKK
jgi:small subunit ribosomal protein S16